MAATIFIGSKYQEYDATGAPLAGGQVFTYAAGTLTPLATYTSQSGASPNTNPVILDAYGRANIWFGPYPYRVIVKDADGVLAPAGDVDNIVPATTTTQIGLEYVDSFTSVGGMSYLLSNNPYLLSNINVWVGGLKQQAGSYSWDPASPLVLNTSAAYPTNVPVEVRYTTALPLGYANALQINYKSYSGDASRLLSDKLLESYSAFDAGAKGDGVTDDTAAMQRFFNRMSATGGKGVIPPGSYLISSKLTIPVGPLGWCIHGASASSTVFQISTTFSGSTIALQLTGTGAIARFELGGFTIKPNGSTSGSAVLGFQIGDPTVASAKIAGFTFSRLFDVDVLDFATCWQFTHCRMIHMQNCSGWSLGPLQNTVLSITQNGATTSDLVFDQFVGVTTKANANMVVSISSPVGPYNNTGANFTIAGIKFRACDFYAGMRAISIFAGGGSLVGDIWFSGGCQIDQQTTNCVYIESQNTGTEIANVHFDGMYFNQATAGSMIVTSTGSLGTVRGLYVDKCQFIAASAQAVICTGTGVISPVFSDNQIIDCANTGPAMEFNGTSNPTVTSNKARVDILNQRPYYLIQFDTGCTNIQCYGNDSLNGVNISTILDNSGDVSKNITGNGGYNPLANASISVGSSPFTWKNTLGSTATVFVTGGTVSAVTLSGKAVGSATNGCFAVPQGASLVVTYSSAPTMSYSGH